MKITAAVVSEQHGTFDLEDVLLAEPGDGEVLVRVVATGICHTDSITRHGDLPFPCPACSVTKAPVWWRRSGRT